MALLAHADHCLELRITLLSCEWSDSRSWEPLAKLLEGTQVLISSDLSAKLRACTRPYTSNHYQTKCHSTYYHGFLLYLTL